MPYCVRVFICFILYMNLFYLLKYSCAMLSPDGMKLYMSDNRVVLTEGFVLPKYFAQVAKWRKWKAVPLNLTVKKDLE